MDTGRIAAVLDLYLTGKSRWRTVEQFHADGMQSLYRATGSHGGVPYWRGRYAPLEGRADQGNGGPWWSDARIRRHLGRLCSARGTFRTKVNFLAAGESGLDQRARRAAASPDGPRR